MAARATTAPAPAPATVTAPLGAVPPLGEPPAPPTPNLRLGALQHRAGKLRGHGGPHLKDFLPRTKESPVSWVYRTSPATKERVIRMEAESRAKAQEKAKRQAEPGVLATAAGAATGPIVERAVKTARQAPAKAKAKATLNVPQPRQERAPQAQPQPSPAPQPRPGHLMGKRAQGGTFGAGLAGAISPKRAPRGTGPGRFGPLFNPAFDDPKAAPGAALHEAKQQARQAAQPTEAAPLTARLRGRLDAIGKRVASLGKGRMTRAAREAARLERDEEKRKQVVRKVHANKPLTKKDMRILEQGSPVPGQRRKKEPDPVIHKGNKEAEQAMLDAMKQDRGE